MKQIKIAGHPFELLTDYEAKLETAKCNHVWQAHRKEVVVNPAAQFVKGYGQRLITVDICDGRICTECGLFEIESEVEKAVKTGEFERILTQRNRTGRRTICELLRELHDETDDEAMRDKIAMCLLIAKKMNDKLVQYIGYDRLAEWYDEETGEFRE